MGAADQGQLGRYQLVRKLATGGMAEVFLAKAVGPGGFEKTLVVKRILPGLAEDPSFVEMFLSEARLAAQLNHPNIAQIFDFGDVAGTWFLAMELVRGVDFDHVIHWNHGPLSEALVVAVVAQALEGLHAAHELRGDDGDPLGLVHRDLSPHNLMVGFDGRVKVLDFGVAKVRDQRTVTLAGIVKGKPVYMSPEQATAERIDRRSDLFSMGLILYEALMGQRAFTREDDTRTMEAIVNDPVARPPRIPPRLWDVIARALEKAPEQRYRTALEMAQALREVSSLMRDDELGRLVRTRFPRRVEELERLEQTKGERAQAQR